MKRSDLMNLNQKPSSRASGRIAKLPMQVH